MIFFISITLFFISITNFIKHKNIVYTSILSVWLWYIVRYIAISELDPKYLVILCCSAIIPSIISSLAFENIVYNKIKKLFEIVSHTTSLALAISSSLLISYFHFYGQFGETQLLGVLQTNFNESIEGAKTFVGLRFFAYIIIFCIFIYISYIISYVIKKINIDIKNKIKLSTNQKYIFTLVCSILVLIIASQQDFDQKNMMVRFVKSYFKTYKKSFEIGEERKKIEVPDYTSVYDSNAKKTIILVIGESATKNHIGAYGYFRNTTPWLSQQADEGKAIIFKNAFSSHALTAMTVPLILSESWQDSFDSIPAKPSIINILDKLKYNTYLFSNQGQFQGALYLYPLLNEIQFKHFTSIQYLNRSNNYDCEMIEKIKSNIDYSNSNFIVIHLMGSHFHYEYRYPESFAPDLQKIENGFYGIINDEKLSKIDQYDKSIAYTDNFLKLLTQSFSDEENTAIVYLSDHGESVIGNFQHDYSKDMNPDIFSIPFIIWTTPSYAKNYAENIKELTNYKNLYITNDRTNDIIKFLAGIDVDLNNIFLKNFDEVRILHNTKSLNDLTSGIIRQKIIDIKSKSGSPCVSSKTNTLKKLMLAQDIGFDGVEIDLMHDKNTHSLIIGTQQKNSNLSLNIFLDQMQNWDFKKLILDIHNIDINSAPEIFQILDEMDKLYSIKNRTSIIVPSDYEYISNQHIEWNVFIDNTNNHTIESKESNQDVKNINYAIIKNIDSNFNTKNILFLEDEKYAELKNEPIIKNLYDSIIYRFESDGDL